MASNAPPAPPARAILRELSGGDTQVPPQLGGIALWPGDIIRSLQLEQVPAAAVLQYRPKGPVQPQVGLRERRQFAEPQPGQVR